MKMNLMSITPLHPMLYSPASVSYSSGKKKLFRLYVYVDITMNCFYLHCSRHYLSRILAHLLLLVRSSKEQVPLVSRKLLKN